MYCYILLSQEIDKVKILITNGSSIPIYEQIQNSIKEMIMDGSIQEDEQLPSVRSLASQLKISILTVKKAYDELEREGFIVTRQGLGSFVVSDNRELRREEKQKQLEQHLIKVCKLAKLLDLKKEELYELFDFIYMEDKHGK